MEERSTQARLAVLMARPAAPETAGDAARRVTSRGIISRDRIIEAALALLAEGGYAALSISAVCKRARVSAASLYHHFGDKAGLMAAMIEDSITGSARRFAEFLSDRERPLEQIEAYLSAIREIGRDSHGDGVAVLLALAQARGDSPEVAAAVDQARKRAWRFVAAEFSDRFELEDGMLFTHLQFAFTSYIAHVAQSSPSRDDARALFESYRRILLITAAAIRPALLADPAFAAAVAGASEDRPLRPAPAADGGSADE